MASITCLCIMEVEEKSSGACIALSFKWITNLFCVIGCLMAINDELNRSRYKGDRKK